MADSKNNYWFCKICPAAEECSEQAFSRAKCWGWTLGECKNRVYKHLQSSGKHTALSKADRTSLTDNAEYEEITQVQEEAPPSWDEDGHVEDDGLPDEEDDGPVVPPPAPVAQRKHKGKGKDKPNPDEEDDAVASGSKGIARVLDTLVEAASVEPKWEPPSDDEVEDIKSTLRLGFDRPKDEGGWASRPDLREKGYGKGNRPRGGGPRSKWMSKWHRCKKQGMTWEDFVKENPEPPRSAAPFP